MLKLLNISNIAVINKLQVEFERGLNLLTGETGSGKSIIIDSLNLLLGTRASQDMIRTGEEAARVEGLFLLSERSPVWAILQGAGIDAGDGELIVRRELSASGRSKIFINNSLATLATLREIGTLLVDIHGQHDHQLLLNPQYHLDLIDLFGETEPEASNLAALYREIVSIDQKIKSLQMDEQQRLKMIDMLSFQVNEIENARLSADEESALLAERNILMNAEKLFSLTSESYQALYDSETSALTHIRRVLRNLEDLSRIDPKFQAHLSQLEGLKYQLEDLAYYVRDYMEGLDFSQDRLDHVERRLVEIDKLKRKYGQSIADVLDYLHKIKSELNEISSRKEHEAGFTQQLGTMLEDYMSKARALSEKRRQAARKLEEAMRKALHKLAMESTSFKVEFAAQGVGTARGSDLVSRISSRGIDSVEFLVATNQGEAPRPMSRVASGGELSRLILALKTIIAADDPEKALVFDEVDSGIGGRVAEVVGRKLKQVARNNQVLCITHLPQIASFADEHYHVYKQVRGGRTETFIERLDPKRRVEEIARMLGGEKVTDTATKHAKEMLQLADNVRALY